MNLVKWDPWVDREIFLGEWGPAVDIQETEKEYVLKADLPEVRKEDVKVQTHDSVLTVEGERKQEKEAQGRKFHRIERAYGKLIRRFSLPTEVDAGAIHAEFTEGVLTIHLPKSDAATPKSVEVPVA
jgi:HSP20 family protein